MVSSFLLVDLKNVCTKSEIPKFKFFSSWKKSLWCTLHTSSSKNIVYTASIQWKDRLIQQCNPWPRKRPCRRRGEYKVLILSATKTLTTFERQVEYVTLTSLNLFYFGPPTEAFKEVSSLTYVPSYDNNDSLFVGALAKMNIMSSLIL